MKAAKPEYAAHARAMKLCMPALLAQAEGLVAAGQHETEKYGLWVDHDYHLPDGSRLRVTLRVSLDRPKPAPAAPPAPKPNPLLIAGPR